MILFKQVEGYIQFCNYFITIRQVKNVKEKYVQSSNLKNVHLNNNTKTRDEYISY